MKRVPNLFQYLQSQVQASTQEARAKRYGLTPRELHIISGVVAGLANKGIACRFKIA